MPIVTFEPGDVVVVPFPFTDKQASKRRPALILSDATAFDTGYSVMAMITSRTHASWPLDVPLRDGDAAGLSAASAVRMKLFALDNRLILRKIGSLASDDMKTVAGNLKHLFGKFLAHD